MTGPTASSTEGSCYYGVTAYWGIRLRADRIFVHDDCPRVAGLRMNLDSMISGLSHSFMVVSLSVGVMRSLERTTISGLVTLPCSLASPAHLTQFQRWSGGLCLTDGKAPAGPLPRSALLN